MDPLVLIGVKTALASFLPGSILRDVRDEPPHRFRLSFESEHASYGVVVSLRAELPWIGTSDGMARASKLKSAFAAACSRVLGGRVVEQVELVGSDRVLAMRFSGGSALLAELASHGANLLILDESNSVSAQARSPRAARQRSAVGTSYVARPLPHGLLVAAGATAAEIDAVLRTAAAEGESLFEGLRRRCLGVGSAGARMVVEESALEQQSPGSVLASRFEQLRAGAIGPVVRSRVADPLTASRAGNLAPDALELLPWRPRHDLPGTQLIEGQDAAATAGIFHASLETVVALHASRDALHAILQREIRRLRAGEERALADAASFAGADRHRRFGEAILAGLSTARRVGDHVLVPDPYDPEAREIAIPAPPSLTLPAAAEDHFRRNRRARRGVETAGARAATLRTRRLRIEALAEKGSGDASLEAVEGLMAAMRAEGLAVGLEPRTRASIARARSAPPRLEGVRLYTSSEGISILAGRTGRDNDRLTFRLAAAEDFWFHVAGQPGAHVVLRNPQGLTRPPEASLREAAAVAAWFSDARAAAAVDVQWTRRKYVRRARGKGAGTVLIKRSETIRVRPVLPQNFAEEP